MLTRWSMHSGSRTKPCVSCTPRYATLTRMPSHAASKTLVAHSTALMCVGLQPSYHHEPNELKEWWSSCEQQQSAFTCQQHPFRSPVSVNSWPDRCCTTQMEEMEAVVEAQRRAVDAAARIANDARDSQGTAVQELQLSLQK
jgi:hypothetical protein